MKSVPVQVTRTRLQPAQKLCVSGAIDRAMAAKPERHGFFADRLGRPAVARHMSATGG